jgi:Tfp pilus assembly protein FimT
VRAKHSSVWESGPASRDPHPSRGEPPPRGITLVELTILTITLLIVVCIAIPIVSPTLQQYRLKGAAWQLAGDLRLARQRAVATQKRFRICIGKCKITVPEGGYSVEMELPPAGSLKWTSDTGAPARLPPDVTIDGDTVTFAANGGADANTFTLASSIGIYQVTVTQTGRIAVTLCQGKKCP